MTMPNQSDANDPQEPTFDVRAVFNEDYYFHFYASALSDEERSDRQAALIWSLGGLAVGDRLLDVGAVTAACPTGWRGEEQS